MSRHWLGTVGVWGLALALLVLVAGPVAAQRGGGRGGGGRGGGGGGGFRGGGVRGSPGFARSGFAPSSFRGSAASFTRANFNSFRGRGFNEFRGRDFDDFRRGRFFAGLGVGLGLGAAFGYPWYGLGWGGYGGWGYDGGWGGYGYGDYGSWGAGSYGTDVAAAAYTPLVDNATEQAVAEVAARQDQQTLQRYANAVMIRVLVPSSDAQLVFNGDQTTQTGKIRVFASPPLDPGQEYTYTIQAQWTSTGREVKQTKQVTVHAGDRVTVEFREPGAKSAPGTGVPETIKPGTTEKPVPAPPPAKIPPPSPQPETPPPPEPPVP